MLVIDVRQYMYIAKQVPLYKCIYKYVFHKFEQTDNSHSANREFLITFKPKVHEIFEQAIKCQQN